MTEEEIIKNLYAALTQFGKAIQDYQELLTTKIKDDPNFALDTFSKMEGKERTAVLEFLYGTEQN